MADLAFIYKVIMDYSLSFLKTICFGVAQFDMVIVNIYLA